MLVTRQVSPSSVPQTVREALAAFVVLPGLLAFSSLSWVSLPRKKQEEINWLSPDPEKQ